MKHSTGNPTKAQEHRFREFQRIGCYPCRTLNIFNVPEVQHIVEGNRRLGHDFTLPWCPWHHRGVGPAALMHKWLGPSFALEPGAFRRRFGRERIQLEKVNDLLTEAQRLNTGE